MEEEPSRESGNGRAGDGGRPPSRQPTDDAAEQGDGRAGDSGRVRKKSSSNRWGSRVFIGEITPTRLADYAAEHAADHAADDDAAVEQARVRDEDAEQADGGGDCRRGNRSWMRSPSRLVDEDGLSSSHGDGDDEQAMDGGRRRQPSRLGPVNQLSIVKQASVFPVVGSCSVDLLLMDRALSMSLDDIINSKKSFGRGKLRGVGPQGRGVRGSFGSGRMAEVGTLHQRSLGVNARPSAFTIAKARLFLL
ncbi:hypothetical protein Dimus_033198 [Dionaea muscipula]